MKADKCLYEEIVHETVGLEQMGDIYMPYVAAGILERYLPGSLGGISGETPTPYFPPGFELVKYQLPGNKDNYALAVGSEGNGLKSHGSDVLLLLVSERLCQKILAAG